MEFVSSREAALCFVALFVLLYRRRYLGFSFFYVKSSAVHIQMEDVEIALLLSLYVVLIQMLCACRPSYAFEDDIVMESLAGAWTLLDLHYYHIVMSIAALYNYRISTRLICFEDDLRYWIKPRCTLWFS